MQYVVRAGQDYTAQWNRFGGCSQCSEPVSTSVYRYGVGPSLSPIRLLQQRAAGLLLWARRVGLLHGRRCSSTGPQHGAQQQMRAVPRLQLKRGLS